MCIVCTSFVRTPCIMTPVCHCYGCSPALRPRGVVPSPLLDVLPCAICTHREGGGEGIITTGVAEDTHPRGGRLGAVVARASEVGPEGEILGGRKGMTICTALGGQTDMHACNTLTTPHHSPSSLKPLPPTLTVLTVQFILVSVVDHVPR